MNDNWILLLDLLLTTDYRDMSAAQKDASLCFFYDAEVQDGGHIRYFSNSQGKNYKETIDALLRIGALKQKEILENIVGMYKELELSDIQCEKDFIDKVLVGYEYEFECGATEDQFFDKIDQYDDNYYHVTPNVMDLILEYTKVHKDKFN